MICAGERRDREWKITERTNISAGSRPDNLLYGQRDARAMQFTGVNRYDIYIYVHERLFDFILIGSTDPNDLSSASVRNERNIAVFHASDNLVWQVAIIWRIITKEKYIWSF